MRNRRAAAGTPPPRRAPAPLSWIPSPVPPSTPPPWTLNQPYTGTSTVTGSGPFTNLTQSGLPPGLTAALSGGTITLSGTPTTANSFTNVQLGVTDADGVVGARTYTLTINPAVT